MSFARKPYDDCAFDTYKKTTTGPYQYMMFKQKYENVLLNDSAPHHCSSNGRVCFTCSANNNSIKNDWSSIELRVDIESDLKQSRLLSHCPAQKKLPCEFVSSSDLSVKKMSPYENNYGVDFCNSPAIVNPRICERHINPSNVWKFDPNLQLLEK